MGRVDSQQIQYTVQDTVPASGTISLVPASSGFIVSPRSAFVSSHNSQALEFSLSTGSGSIWCHGHIPGNDSKIISWPEGFELPIGSGVECAQ